MRLVEPLACTTGRLLLSFFFYWTPAVEREFDFVFPLLMLAAGLSSPDDSEELELEEESAEALSSTEEVALVFERDSLEDESAAAPVRAVSASVLT